METSNTGQSDAAAKPKCPLCGSGDTLFETKIGIDLIVQSYWKEQRELVKHDLKGTPWIEVYRCQRCSLVFFDPELPGSPEFYAGFQSFDWYYL
jgi:rubredoxin